MIENHRCMIPRYLCLIPNRISIWLGEPNAHVWGWPRFRPRDFSPFFPVRGSGAPSPTTESDHSAPVSRDKNINPTSTRRVRDHSTRRSNQVLNLTDYHISRYVASTFKRLTKWATHDLSHFWLHQRGITTTQPRPLSLYFSRNLKSVKIPICSQEAGNPSTSTVPN